MAASLFHDTRADPRPTTPWPTPDPPRSQGPAAVPATRHASGQRVSGVRHLTRTGDPPASPIGPRRLSLLPCLRNSRPPARTLTPENRKEAMYAAASLRRRAGGALAGAVLGALTLAAPAAATTIGQTFGSVGFAFGCPAGAA